MKKILYVTTISKTINAFFIPHIKKLIDEGYKVDIACSIEMKIDESLLEYPVQTYDIDFSRNPLSLANISAYKKIRELVKKNKYDIVHVHTPIASFITRMAIRNFDLKVLYTAHGFHFYQGAPLLNWIIYHPLEKLAARWTDRIITINTEDFNRAMLFKLRNNGDVNLTHGVGIDEKNYELKDFDICQYRKDIGLDKDDFIILILAEINSNKNHIQVIEAIKLLKNKYKNIKVICAGEGPLQEKLKNKVIKDDLGKEVIFLGFRRDVKELIAIANIVGLFSKREGLGKCILEAMIIGCPVIATNTRGPRELIENNQNGFLVEINDYAKTAEAIEKLYLDKSLTVEFINKQQVNVQKYFMNNVLKELMYFYKF